MAGKEGTASVKNCLQTRKDEVAGLSAKETGEEALGRSPHKGVRKGEVAGSGVYISTPISSMTDGKVEDGGGNVEKGSSGNVEIS